MILNRARLSRSISIKTALQRAGFVACLAALLNIMPMAPAAALSVDQNAPAGKDRCGLVQSPRCERGAKDAAAAALTLRVAENIGTNTAGVGAAADSEVAQGRLKLQHSIERVTQAMQALSAGLMTVSVLATAVTTQLHGNAGQSVSSQLPNSGVSGPANDLGMMAKQTLTQQPQQSIELVRLTIETLAPTGQAVIAGKADRGNGTPRAGGLDSCGTLCAAFVNELSNADLKKKLDAVIQAVAELAPVAREQAVRERDSIVRLGIPQLRSLASAGANSNPVSEESFRAATASLDANALVFLIVTAPGSRNRYSMTSSAQASNAGTAPRFSTTRLLLRSHYPDAAHLALLNEFNKSNVGLVECIVSHWGASLSGFFTQPLIHC
jgi:hypothetical protein